MTRFLAVAPAVAQVLLPGGQQFERTGAIRNFVSEIVRPAAVGVDVVEMLVQFARKEPGHDAKILVVVRGEPARVALRFVRAAAFGRQVAGDFEFWSGQHQTGWRKDRGKGIGRRSGNNGRLQLAVAILHVLEHAGKL